MAYEQLKLENQFCFPVYAASRLITRAYQPLLEELGLTYPQYLVLMVLWQTDGIPVNEITQKLILETNTVTPILKRMEAQGLITRERAADDARRVIVHLTPQGRQLQVEAASIPEKLVAGLSMEAMTVEDLIKLKEMLLIIIQHLERQT